eukprot:7720099-Pyramimonas_sp.AAC.1
MQQPIPKGEGLLVRRKLAKGFEPDQPASALGRMRKLMGRTFGTATTETDMIEFDVAVQTHERHDSVVPSEITAAILIAGVQDIDLQQ